VLPSEPPGQETSISNQLTERNLNRRASLSIVTSGHTSRNLIDPSVKYRVPDTPHGSKLNSVRMRVGSAGILTKVFVFGFLYRNAVRLRDQDKFQSCDDTPVTR